MKVCCDRRIGAEGKAFAAIEAAHQVALSALCAEAVGIMKAINATTLEYTKSRKQFGVPIAKFPGAAAPHGGHVPAQRTGDVDELPRCDQVP